MKVAMISPYGPAWIGGISTFTMSLCAALRELGAECEVIVNHGGIAGLATEFSGPKSLFVIRAAAWLLRYRPDILHAHGHWHTLMPAAFYKMLNSKVKLVFTMHTPPRGMPRFGLWIFKRLMVWCDAVTAVSDDIVDWLSHQVPRSIRKLKISPGTAMRPGGYHESRRDLAISEPSYVATFVGTLFWSEKVAGVKLLAQSFREFARRVPESKLYLVGGGPRLSEVQDFVAELDAGAHVVLVGETRDPARYLNACDVYAHVSYMEGLPLSLLDAMSAGKAVIASKVGDIPELVRAGESGILVENREDEIVAALSTLSADPALRDRLGKAGQRLVLGSYTWDSAARKFLSLYGGA